MNSRTWSTREKISQFLERRHRSNSSSKRLACWGKTTKCPIFPDCRSDICWPDSLIIETNKHAWLITYCSTTVNFGSWILSLKRQNLIQPQLKTLALFLNRWLWSNTLYTGWHVYPRNHLMHHVYRRIPYVNGRNPPFSICENYLRTFQYNLNELVKEWNLLVPERLRHSCQSCYKFTWSSQTI